MVVVSCQKDNYSLSVSPTGISVSLQPKTGEYVIHVKKQGWTFKGSVGYPVTNVTKTNGRDSIGSYKAISFNWQSNTIYKGTVRRYNNKPVLLFLLTTPHKTSHIKPDFPSFTTFPDSVHHFSYSNNVFAPPKFRLVNTSTPWLFFNDHGEAFILSPASDFIVSKMKGDGQRKIASGLNHKLSDLPAGFTHKTMLVLGDHIHSTWARWGNALREMYDRVRPGNESDPILKYYGYWTDHGAYYYYKYDKSKGYAGTLMSVKKYYDKKGILMGYIQLDSWWYYKSKYSAGSQQNVKYVESGSQQTVKGAWDNFGGMVRYHASKEIFPHGLDYFHKQIQVPLVVHNRWIDPRSPYNKKYKITGVAAIGYKFWDDIADHLKSVGVVDYEQDWLNVIYNYTLQMASDLSVGNAFTDNMAKAMKSHGINMQYCMATPRFFMQGVKYNNLITIRVSQDRFEPAKWDNLIYTSQLAYALGMWPWSDTFMSHELGNMIVSVLSAGPVGTGDKVGNEVKANILKAARSDGVLVKPDASLLPMESDYIHDAHRDHKPMLAYTYTKQNNVWTNYVFVFGPKNSVQKKDYSFSPSNANLNMRGQVVVYNPLEGTIRKINADSTFTGSLLKGSLTSKIPKMGNTKGEQYRYKYAFYILAPVTPVGIAFLGDKGKIVATGRQRISKLISTSDKLTVQVTFAEGESSVRLHGYYEEPFTTDGGKLILDSSHHTFELTVPAPKKCHYVTIHFKVKKKYI